MEPPHHNNPNDIMISEHSRHHSRNRSYPFHFSPPGSSRHFPPNYAASYLQKQRQILQEPAAGWGELAGDAKLCISNLDSGVTAEDLEILFSELGELRDYSIHYDRKGNSLGTGEVVYVRKADAVAARNRYNGVKLDGKPLTIGFVGEDLMASFNPSPMLVSSAPADSNILFERRYRKRSRESAGGPNHGDQGMTGIQEHEHHRARTVTLEELDADLDNYWMLPASNSR